MQDAQQKRIIGKVTFHIIISVTVACFMSIPFDQPAFPTALAASDDSRDGGAQPMSHHIGCSLYVTCYQFTVQVEWVQGGDCSGSVHAKRSNGKWLSTSGHVIGDYRSLDVASPFAEVNACDR